MVLIVNSKELHRKKAEKLFYASLFCQYVYLLQNASRSKYICRLSKNANTQKRISKELYIPFSSLHLYSLCIFFIEKMIEILFSLSHVHKFVFIACFPAIALDLALDSTCFHQSMYDCVRANT